MKTVALRRRARVLNGGTPTADAENWGGTVPWATPVDLARVDGRQLSATDRTLTDRGAVTGSNVAPAHSVLVSCRAPIGYTATTAQPTAFNQGCKALYPDPRLLPRFLQYVLIANTHRLKAMGSGSTFLELSSESLASTRLPDIPASEQRRIADFLDDRVDRVDKIITARRQQTDSLFERFRHEVVTEASRYQRVPLRRLLAAVRTGTTPDDGANDPNGSAWYSPGSFGESLELGAPARRVTPAGLPRFEAGSVLIVGIGATAGKVAWLRTPATGNQQLTCLVPDPRRLVGRFLLHQLAARTDELLKTAPFATLPIINNEAIRAFELWYPELETQERLSRAWDADLTTVISLRDTLGNSAARLTEYKQSLISAAVSGELDVSTVGSGIPG